MKDNCSKHEKQVLGESDMKVLATAIGNLHYETLTELLTEMRHKIFEDGRNDFLNGRTKLSGFLFDAASGLSQAAQSMEQAWLISKPFMKE